MDKGNKGLWDRSKDGDRREQRSFLRYAIISTVIIVLFLFLKKDNIITWVSSGFTLRRQHRQIEQLNKSNADLDRQLNTLRESKDSLETFARENFLFAAPGDDVYVIGK